MAVGEVSSWLRCVDSQKAESSIENRDQDVILKASIPLPSRRPHPQKVP